MNTMKTLAIAAALTAFSISTAHADEPKATYADIQKTLGLVPSMFKAVPDQAVAAAWGELKSLELNPNTALPGKTKELIGLAVAAQIPCKYCIYFHTQVSGLYGATDEDRKEAVAMAALTRHWSAVTNGLQIDLAEFKQELGRAIAYVKHPTAKGEGGPVTDAASAYKDIEHTFGFVPTFVRRFPEEAVASAWMELKMLELAPNTALDGKTKELVGLAVASQIPCQYCVAYHTEIAKLTGATDQEIREAVALAANTRHWSTILNGAMVDETVFRKETDQVVANAKKAAKH
jgi:AhpD family alkylhydroperoxidase